ncbi:MAG: hypothetical protein WA825_14450 [Steroidobacteraceae bacterium]
MKIDKLTEFTRIASVAILAVATLVGAGVAAADEHDSHYKDLYELKQLHVAFHAAVSHAGVDATTKSQHLADVLALWTDDGVLIAGGVTYSGKGSPGEASCAPGSLTLCDFFANHAGSFVLGRDWVSLTPIFTEAISLDDRDEADIYWQCIYLDANNNDLKVSNVTFGLPGLPDTGRARKVHGRWLFSHVESESVPAPTIDVYE